MAGEEHVRARHPSPFLLDQACGKGSNEADEVNTRPRPMGLWGRCDAVERTRSRPPKPRLGVRKTLTDTRPGAIPAAAGAHPRHHVICTPFPPVPGCE